MKAIVIVTLKSTVLDPQGITIHRNLESLGFSEVSEVRQGKYFEVEVDDDLNEAERALIVKRLAEEILRNPVIEEYRILWE